MWIIATSAFCRCWQGSSASKWTAPVRQTASAAVCGRRSKSIAARAPFRPSNATLTRSVGRGNSRKPSARLCVSMPAPDSAAPSYLGWCSVSACFACCVSTRPRDCATPWCFTTRLARAVSGSSFSWNGSKAARCLTSGTPTRCAGSCWRFSTRPSSLAVPRSVPAAT